MEAVALNYTITHSNVSCVRGTTDITAHSTMSDVLDTISHTVWGEHIKDSFYYKVINDFKLIIDKDTGYFNANKLCHQNGKNFFQWSRLDRSKRLLQEHKNNGGIDAYKIKCGPRNVLDNQISGTYIPLELLEEIKDWMKHANKGYVYVVTNDYLQPQNIYNIGFERNIERRMKAFNKYRQFEPQFYHILLFESENAQDLKTELHSNLKTFALGDDFFKVSSNHIVNTFLATLG